MSFVYHMNDDALEVNGLTPPNVTGSLLPSENKSLGTRLGGGGGGGMYSSGQNKVYVP